MNAETTAPSEKGEIRSPDDAEGRTRLRRLLRRAQGLLKLSRGADAAERLNEFLSNEALEGDARSSDERELLANVLRMRDLRVDDIMVPRADITAVEVDANLDETLSAFREGSHSRLPVYRETLDDPLGVVHLKDVALSHGFGARTNDFSLSDHLRSVLAVPPSMRILALLQRMQATRRHMALVIDEWGGVDGLVTIEDVIEQIVGEIEDEHDDAERPLWIRQADGAYLAEARAFVDEFQEATGLQLLSEDWEEEVDTLGGVVFMLSGRVPERGEVIEHPLGIEFEIVDADPRRIKRVRIRRREDAMGASPKPSSDSRGGAEAGGPASGDGAKAAAPEALDGATSPSELNGAALNGATLNGASLDEEAETLSNGQANGRALDHAAREDGVRLISDDGTSGDGISDDGINDDGRRPEARSSVNGANANAIDLVGEDMIDGDLSDPRTPFVEEPPRANRAQLGDL